MPEFVLVHAPAVRAGVFVAVLALLLAAETLAPRRTGPRLRTLRWGPNLLMTVTGAVAVRVLLPLGAVGIAAWAGAHQVGLFNAMRLPAGIAGVLSFLLLDVLIYAQHRLLHAWPLLWPIHRMHHSDVEFDATTALRFHPLEIVLSMALKMAAVLALGAPPLAVILFEIALNASAMFNHANLKLPLRLDDALRQLVVTPDMHRVHHSTHADEYNRNYGFCLSLWDRLFGSYRAQPREGHEGMVIGQRQFREPAEQTFAALLRQPFSRQSPVAGRQTDD